MATVNRRIDPFFDCVWDIRRSNGEKVRRRKKKRSDGGEIARGARWREEGHVGEHFCNGKLPHEKVVKRGRCMVAGKKGQGGGGADLNIDVEEQ